MIKWFLKNLECYTDEDPSSKCVFPFKHEGKTYTSCTTVGNGGIKWCATSLTSDGTVYYYGNCSPNCEEEEQPGTFSIIHDAYNHF